MNLLLLSNSTQPGHGWLEHAKTAIEHFFGQEDIHPWFIPYAGVSISWDEYYEKARVLFAHMNQTLEPLHRSPNPRQSIASAQGIIVGGGNSFYLLKTLQDLDLLDPIHSQVASGKAKYLGWSAGANLVCPGIYTTNDMPICEPKSLKALGLIDFQINPHYTNRTLEGHGGESRDQRIHEFCQLHPKTKVLGLPEGSYIRVQDSEAILHGAHDGLWFLGSESPKVWEIGQVAKN